MEITNLAFMGKNGARIGTVIGDFGKVGRRSQIRCLVIMGTCNGEDRRRWRRLVKVGHLLLCTFMVVNFFLHMKWQLGLLKDQFNLCVNQQIWSGASVSARTMGSTSADSEENGFYNSDAETCESCEEKSASEDGDGVAAEQTRVGSGAGVSEGGAGMSEGGARLSEAAARLSEERS